MGGLSAGTDQSGSPLDECGPATALLLKRGSSLRLAGTQTKCKGLEPPQPSYQGLAGGVLQGRYHSETPGQSIYTGLLPLYFSGYQHPIPVEKWRLVGEEGYWLCRDSAAAEVSYFYKESPHSTQPFT